MPRRWNTRGRAACDAARRARLAEALRAEEDAPRLRERQRVLADATCGHEGGVLTSATATTRGDGGVAAPRSPRLGVGGRLGGRDAAERLQQAEVGRRERVGVAEAQREVLRGPRSDAGERAERASRRVEAASEPSSASSPLATAAANARTAARALPRHAERRGRVGEVGGARERVGEAERLEPGDRRACAVDDRARSSWSRRPRSPAGRRWRARRSRTGPTCRARAARAGARAERGPGRREVRVDRAAGRGRGRRSAGPAATRWIRPSQCGQVGAEHEVVVAAAARPRARRGRRRSRSCAGTAPSATCSTPGIAAARGTRAARPSRAAVGTAGAASSPPSATSRSVRRRSRAQLAWATRGRLLARPVDLADGCRTRRRTRCR